MFTWSLQSNVKTLKQIIKFLQRFVKYSHRTGKDLLKTRSLPVLQKYFTHLFSSCSKVCEFYGPKTIGEHSRIESESEVYKNFIRLRAAGL